MSSDPEKPNADLWRAMFDARQTTSAVPKPDADRYRTTVTWSPEKVSLPTLDSELNKDRNRSEERPS